MARRTCLALHPNYLVIYLLFGDVEAVISSACSAQHVERRTYSMTLATRTTATTSFGQLRGTVEDGVAVFRGIPYAQPPIGALRFAPPVRVDGWSGTRSAERFGPAAMQAAGAALGERPVGEMDEDCLSLNVWTPALDDRRRPVLVWLH